MTGKPTTGIHYLPDGNIGLVTHGHEAMILIVQSDGAVSIHPDTVAYGDTEKGSILIPAWQGSMGYQRGFGEVASGNNGWSICLGDVVCTAIAEGRIPLHPAENLPESHKPRRLTRPSPRDVLPMSEPKTVGELIAALGAFPEGAKVEVLYDSRAGLAHGLDILGVEDGTGNLHDCLDAGSVVLDISSHQ